MGQLARSFQLEEKDAVSADQGPARARPRPRPEQPLLPLTVLCRSVQGKDLRTVQTLLERGRVDLKDARDFAQCPLHMAVRTPGYIVSQEMAILLIQYGAPVHHSDPLGQTALSWAVHFNNEDLVQCLLDAGAKSRAITRVPPVYSTAANQQARRRREEPIRALLLEYERQPRPLMHLARLSVRKQCLRCGPNVIHPINELNLPEPLKRYLKLLL